MYLYMYNNNILLNTDILCNIIHITTTRYAKHMLCLYITYNLKVYDYSELGDMHKTL